MKIQKGVNVVAGKGEERKRGAKKGEKKQKR